jgi:hypothetical protein
MSLAGQTTDPDPQMPLEGPDPDACVHCGTPLAEDQEWCLECGAARTLIHRPPDWRVPVAVIGTVVAVAVAALAVALINVSGSADPSVITRTVVARAPQASGSRPKPASKTGVKTAAKTTPTTSTTPSTPTTTATLATPPGIASWPLALSEWTVVLARYPDQATANATALRVKAEGLPAGVLNSSDHPSLKPGGWLVFTGHYRNRAQALAAAQQLRAQGHTARARRVAPTAGQ